MSLGFCLLGAGEAAEYHARELQLNAVANLLSIASRTPSRTRNFAYRHGIGRIHSDPWFLLDERDVDIAVIATPTIVHVQEALPFVRKGSGVIVEAPLSGNAPSALSLLREAEEEGVYLGECNTLLFVPALRTLKGLLEEKRLGEDVVVSLEYHEPFPASWWKGEERPHYLWDQGYRALELLLWLMGEGELLPRETRSGKEGEEEVLLKYRGSVGRASALFSSVLGRKTLMLEARGGKGHVRVENDRIVEWNVAAPRPREGKGSLSPYTYLHEYYDAFLSSLFKGGEVEPSFPLISRTICSLTDIYP